MPDIFDSYEESPQSNPAKKSGDIFDEYPEHEESSLKSFIRSAAQVPQGIAEATLPGIVGGVWQLLAMGEVLDPEEIEQVRKISEREGIPFDEEKYLEAAQHALETVPTVSNIARFTERKTGIPLEPKSKLQKAIRLGSTAMKLAPQPGAFRGTNTGLPSPVLGAGVAGTSQALQALDVPESFADIASFGILKGLPAGSPQISVGPKKKPSGLTERRFEKLKEPAEVPESKIENINHKLEREFRGITDKIIAESPIGETHKAMAEDVGFKKAAGEAFQEVEDLASQIPDKFSSEPIKRTLVSNIIKKQGRDLLLSEYDKAYNNHVMDLIKSTSKEDTTASGLVRTFRKNNKSLTELYEPGQSFAYNRAKRNALLDYNRAIADLIEEQFPNSDFSKLFTETNAQWAEIMDAEAINKFMDNVFDGKINFKKGKDLFVKNGMDVPFKRAMGEEGFAKFDQLTKDLLSVEQAHGLMRKAKDAGWGDYLTHALSYMLHPKAGAIHAGISIGRKAYKSLWQMLLDKPQLAATWDKGVQAMKKGDYKTASDSFKVLDAELLEHQPEAKASPKQGETIDVKAESITPEAKAKPEAKKKLTPKEEAHKAHLKKDLEENSTGGPGQPKLLEYNPSESPTPQQKKQNLAKDIFNKASEGKKISETGQKILKNTPVTILQTRKKGQQFHGTKKPIKQLNNDIYNSSSEQNIYGAGFYTTDALDIADGYAGKKGIKSTVYTVNEIKPQKLYNAEESIKDFKKAWTEKEKEYFEIGKNKIGQDPFFGKKYKGTFEEFIKNDDYILNDILYNENPKSVREFYDKIRERAIDENMKAYEVQEYFDQIQLALEKMGYEGLAHKGGLLTNSPEHLVKIYWKPENLQIQEFSYPKEFKKVAKTAKIPKASRNDK